MDPEAILVIVASAWFGLSVWPVAFVAGFSQHELGQSEAEAWRRLMLPVFAGTVLIFFLWGWALQEPDPADERVGSLLYVLAAITTIVVSRALVRATKALRSAPVEQVPIATVGVLVPRIVVSKEFRCTASDRVLAAALAHETAHCERRDPLRIWLGQLGADLQWPMPGTARRFSAWLVALEADRDDLALARGAVAEDLAEAILVAARLGGSARLAGSANATGAGAGIAWRVRRLTLGVAPGDRRVASTTPFRVACVLLVVGALILGLEHGDAVLGLLPGMSR